MKVVVDAVSTVPWCAAGGGSIGAAAGAFGFWKLTSFWLKQDIYVRNYTFAQLTLPCTFARNW